MTRLHLPQIMIVRLRAHDVNIVIITPEKSGFNLVFAPIMVGRIVHPGRSDRCCPVRTPGGSLLCRRCLLAPIAVNKEGNEERMARQVRPTPTRFPTNILYAPLDSTPRFSKPSVCTPSRGAKSLSTRLKGLNQYVGDRQTTDTATM